MSAPSTEFRVTILHLLLLMHYKCSAEEYARHEPTHAGSPAVRRCRTHLFQWGLIQFTPDRPGWGHPYAVTPRGEAYLEAIKTTPLPVATWAVPARPSPDTEVGAGFSVACCC